MNTERSLPTQDAEPSAKEVKMKVDCEVRFAVVMYGGVSLAIYINGVAQELLNLVRATAPKERDSNISLLTDKQLTGAGKVYRKLGQYLNNDHVKLNAPSSDPIRTKFIVDVISGTSAGGINGIFLAKALAQNQTMDGLKQLWLSEGDLDKLLNDKRSLKGLSGFTIKKPQESLLNSQRMYRKLLEALAQMDHSGTSSSVYQRGWPRIDSPLVTELDLFTTTTDIEGIPLPIPLSDRVIFERRYKNVFHFRYERRAKGQTPRNDFVACNDPFLAFAARCTSSFPFAFEPMCLNHITDITENYPRYTGAKHYIAEWDGFFSDYLRPGLFDLDRDSRGEPATGQLPDGRAPNALEKAIDDLRESFMARSFGDGGYLDNKPFTYATSTLMRRFADCAVKRKLLYVEPTPEHPELLRSNPNMPDFAENVRAAVFDLPTQETIREDIERLFERNRVLKRLTTFALEVDEDIALKPFRLLSATEFLDGYVPDVVKEYGVGYGPYHRLKVGEITTFLGNLVARAKGHDPDSNAGSAIRELVAAWRRARYAPRPLESKQSENRFLFTFDLHYRFRRVVFLLRRVNDLVRVEPLGSDRKNQRLKRLLSVVLHHAREHPEREIGSLINPEINREADYWLNSQWPPNASDESSAHFQIWFDGFSNELERIKAGILSPALNKLRATESELLALKPNPNANSSYEKNLNALWQWLQKVDVPWTDLSKILEVTDDARTASADQICEAHSADFDLVAEHFDAVLAESKPRISEAILGELAAPNITEGLLQKLGIGVPIAEFYSLQGALAARLCLLYYNKNFISYDMVTYPVEYGTGAGETNEVEVFRVSPEDAPSLMTEQPGDEQSKLAGRTLMSFGAFLDEGWRRNDMLWGRLDGAERLIISLLPGEDNRETREPLIREAHLGIIKEEIEEGNIDAVCRLLSHALAHTVPREPCRHNLINFVREVLAQNKSLLSPAQQTALTKPQTFDRQLKARRALEYISRSTNITGDMLSGLADKYHSERGKTLAKWVAGVGSTFWTVIAVAVPQSLGNLFFRHLLGLFYAFAFVVIFVGIFLNNSVKFAGWQVLGILVLIHLTVAGVSAFMSSRRWFMKLVVGAMACPVVALIVLGILRLVKRWRHFKFDREHELALAIVAAIAIVSFLVVVPMVVRAGLNVFRRWRPQFNG